MCQLLPNISNCYTRTRRFLTIVAASVVVFLAPPTEARTLWGLPNLFASPSQALAESNIPHPAVARIIVPESDGTAYGSGTLVDVRGDYGLVVTNHHVVEYAAGPIEVVFPNGFRSFARAQKLDSDWDLAALAIWRPENITPVKMADRAPRPGEVLTICGYGKGQYRSITGRCTDYFAPSIGMPRELVELDVEARQGDSGGPIFNANNELAGVLFGAGQGTTLGSFGGRVKGFLATLAPDIGARSDEIVVAKNEEKPSPNSEEGLVVKPQTAEFAEWQSAETKSNVVEPAAMHEPRPVDILNEPPEDSYSNTKSFLVAICALAIAMQFLRLFR